LTESRIRIVSVPAGQAPLWVRQKWVGLELPLSLRHTPVTTFTRGVLTKPSLAGFLWRLVRGKAETATGYAVEAGRAVAILEASHPDAAHWWQQNTPQLLRQGKCFLFRAEACEVVNNSTPNS
jgi:hypothetical protein